jgi:hypothetical protein
VLSLGALEHDDLAGPLSAFRHHTAARTSILEMVHNINELCVPGALPVERLDAQFGRRWAEFEAELAKFSDGEFPEMNLPRANLPRANFPGANLADTNSPNAKFQDNLAVGAACEADAIAEILERTRTIYAEVKSLRRAQIVADSPLAAVPEAIVGSGPVLVFNADRPSRGHEIVELSLPGSEATEFLISNERQPSSRSEPPATVAYTEVDFGGCHRGDE